MVQIVFLTQQNAVFFSCSDIETAHKTIRDFEDLMSRITKELDQILWGEDEHGNKNQMIRCSQVIGFYMREEQEAWKR